MFPLGHVTSKAERDLHMRLSICVLSFSVEYRDISCSPSFRPPMLVLICSVHFSSVARLSPTLCNPLNRSTPGLPVHHQLLESTQTHVHWVGDTIQPSHPLESPSPPALNLSSIRGFSNESALCIKWPKYWSFNSYKQAFWLQSHHFMVNRRGKVEAVTDLIFLGSKSTADGDCSH